MNASILTANPDVVPFRPTQFPALDPDTEGQESICTISSDAGLGVMLWSATPTMQSKATTEVTLRLSPDAPAIIGRKEGGEIEYLDPKYVPTPIVPGTGKTILKQDGWGEDCYVSRGHFMLRARAGGILLVNGVPRRGGGIRPPRNGTKMLAPEARSLLEAEEVMIEKGNVVAIELPNGTRLSIQAS